MAVSYIEIKIPEDPYSRQEQFKELGHDFEIGDQGTIRIENYSFRDGEAVYLNLGRMEVRRNAGFQQPLSITNGSQENRVYFFLGGQWVQQTIAPNSNMTGLQQRVGQYGFWLGIYQWAQDVGENIGCAINVLLTPLFVVPVLVIQCTQYIWGLFCLVILSITIWQMIINGLLGVLFG